MPFCLVGLVLWFGLTFFMAEICRRVCLFLEEVTHLTTRYEGSLSRLMLRVFSARHSANFAAVVLLLSLLFVSVSCFYRCSPLLICIDFAFKRSVMPIHWLWKR